MKLYKNFVKFAGIVIEILLFFMDMNSLALRVDTT